MSDRLRTPGVPEDWPHNPAVNALAPDWFRDLVAERVGPAPVLAIPTAPPPIRLLATGPDWTWYCDATIAFHVDNPHRRHGRCRCGWRTSEAHPSQMRELMELCDRHRDTSSQRRDAYLRSLPPDPRAGEPGYLEELDAQIRGGLDAMRAIADEMEGR